MKRSKKQSISPENSESEDESETSDQMEASSNNTPVQKEGRKRLSSRQIRRERKQGIRVKSLGVGISITTENTPSKGSAKNTKIVFDENEGEEDNHDFEAENDEKAVDAKDDNGVDDDDDDDDDAVEQMESSVARDLALKQRALERKTAKVAAAFQARPTRKKNSESKELVSVDDNNDDEDLDEDFFAKVDASKITEKKMQKKKSKGGEYAGLHTKFVASEDAAAIAAPVQINQNIELVVLGDDRTSSTTPFSSGYDQRTSLIEAQFANNPSDETMIYSRDQIIDGSYVPSWKQKKKTQKKGAHKAGKQDIVEGWKRSKKMGRLLLSGSRRPWRKGKGKVG